MKKVLLFSPLLFLALTSCSGSGGGGKSPNAGTTSGKLLDSAVGGAYYRSDSQSGKTNDNGDYLCKSGEEVEFYLKGNNDKEISLGSVACRSVTSPIDIVSQGQFTITTPLSNLSGNQQVAVVNMLRLLQSLDTDGNPSNGITVRPSEVSILADELESSYTLNVALSSMAIDGTFDAKLTTVMGVIGRPVVSESAAIAHFNETVSKQNPTPCEGESCEEENPQNPPVITPPTTPEECMAGLSYATSTFGGGGINYGSSHLIEADGSIDPSAPFSESVNMIVIIKSNNVAEVYRAKRNAQSAWFSFSNAGWESNSSGELTIKSVQFSNKTVDLKFTSRQDFGGGSMGRYGTQNSFGSFVSSFDRMFRANGCSAPVSAIVTPVTQAP